MFGLYNMDTTLISSDLAALLACHSTPGDEGEVAALLEKSWRAAGWQVRRHGTYALSAGRPHPGQQRPRLLVCAHMDSPGFTVECLGPRQISLVTLGGAQFAGMTTPGVLKTRAGPVPVTIRRRPAGRLRPRDQYALATAAVPGTVTHGDRVCFATPATFSPAGLVHAPFLDNRLGCALLCELARRLPAAAEAAFELVLGATGCEEMGGFGAPVLAAAVQPDAVICVDATYEALDQGVRVGGGPVLTLSDASVLLSPQTRDRVREWFDRQALPLQTEVYNYSGTDSRAFPHAGLTCPVLPLLLATRGNHTPSEEADLGDLRLLCEAVCRWAAAPPVLA